ncbi:MAG: hypothetical protein ACTSXK_14010 [Promethearchaeota archaeon]
MIKNNEFLPIFFFETDIKIISITSIFLIMVILSLFLLILPDFLPKLMILLIEIGCILLIFQISKDVSYDVNYYLDLMRNFQGITEISLEYLELFIDLEIQVNIIKTMSLMVLLVNFFFTFLELL